MEIRLVLKARTLEHKHFHKKGRAYWNYWQSRFGEISLTGSCSWRDSLLFWYNKQKWQNSLCWTIATGVFLNGKIKYSIRKWVQWVEVQECFGTLLFYCRHSVVLLRLKHESWWKRNNFIRRTKSKAIVSKSNICRPRHIPTWWPYLCSWFKSGKENILKLYKCFEKKKQDSFANNSSNRISAWKW